MAGIVAKVIASIRSTRIDPGKTVTFTVQALDSDGNKVPNAKFSISYISDNTIVSAGLYGHTVAIEGLKIGSCSIVIASSLIKSDPIIINVGTVVPPRIPTSIEISVVGV